jgi:branched-chain amino acid aminotransferase
MKENIYYVDGQLLPESKAVISVMDHGFLYGDGVFDAFRVYDSAIYKFDEHIDRLFDSAKIIDLEIPMSRAEFKDVVVETIRANGFSDAYVRPQVSRGVGKLGSDPRTCKKATVVVYVTPPPALKASKTIRVIVSSYRRPSGYMLPTESKMTQYLNNILAKIESTGRGADDAILLNDRGFVCEGSGWNVFIVNGNKVVTPSHTSGILRGITRDSVISLLKQDGMQVEEREVVLSELFTASEVFGTGSGTEITPVVEVGGRRVGAGDVGKVTSRAEKLFFEDVKRNGTKIL